MWTPKVCLWRNSLLPVKDPNHVTSLNLLPPAYVVRREGNVLTRVCPSVCPQGGRGYLPWPCPRYLSTPWPGQDGGEGVPQRTYPHPRPRTCYTAGGMPLAFTREDFLVDINKFIWILWSWVLVNFIKYFRFVLMNSDATFE